MLYVIKKAVQEKDNGDFKVSESLGVEEFDIKPEKGDLIILKDGRQFLVRGIIHKSKLHKNNTEADAPTTELLVTDDDLYFD